MTRVATHLITGFAGAGKTTLLRALLALRPRAEHWALLLNGSGGINNAVGVTVRQITDGCACCSARVSFRTALVQLLRVARPQRLLIELSGSGDPAGVKVVLNEEAMQRAVALTSTLCVVQPRQLADTAISALEIYAAQLRYADYVVMAQADGLTHAAPTRIHDAPVTMLKDVALTLLEPGAAAQSSDSSRQIPR